MRPGQNKRMRGRPNNNRRGPNPLTRSYESNGPDVKIRGNAHHVAEKYLQLARDAHTSSDPVAAENYLQHAEHYFRLIASAQAAQLQQQNGYVRQPGESDADDMDDDDDVGGLSDRFASPAERAPAPYQNQPSYSAPVQGQPQPQIQPYQERAPYESDRQPQNDRAYQGRPDRSNNNNRQPDRGPRDNRPYHERQDNRDNREPRENRDTRSQRDNRPREYRPYRDPNPPREIVSAPEAALAPTLPSFITAPPRVIAAPEMEEAQFSSPASPEPAPPMEAEAAPIAGGPIEEAEAAPRFPARGRRRRARPAFGFDSPGAGQPEAAQESEQPAHSDKAPAGD
jgi:uncharacterized protein DUF4167